MDFIVFLISSEQLNTFSLISDCISFGMRFAGDAEGTWGSSSPALLSSSADVTSLLAIASMDLYVLFAKSIG